MGHVKHGGLSADPPEDRKIIRMSPGGSYALTGLVGQGSSGKFYKGYSYKRREHVGIKILDLDRIANIEDAVSEIPMLCELRSPYVISYYDSIIDETNLWIVMEYAAGGSVGDLIKALRPSLAVASLITSDVLHALVYLHETAKIIHGDIKAANILVTASGSIKVCDFGVSKKYTSADGRSPFAGTPYWMAPEVVRCANHNHKADIWSLGITVIEILTGKPPMLGSSLKEHMLSLSISRVPNIDGSRHAGYVKSFVKMCLRSDYTQRPDARTLLGTPFIRRFSKGAKCIFDLLPHDHLCLPPLDTPGAPISDPSSAAPMSASDDPGCWSFGDEPAFSPAVQQQPPREHNTRSSTPAPDNSSSFDCGQCSEPPSGATPAPESPDDLKHVQCQLLKQLNECILLLRTAINLTP